MNWFLVKMIYQITCGEGNHTPQFDEQLKLVSAEANDDVFLKAETYGLSGEESFYNQRHQLVKWQFVGVAEIYPFHQLMDGVELYSSINEVDNAEAYIRLINHKSARLKEDFVSAQLVE